MERTFFKFHQSGGSGWIWTEVKFASEQWRHESVGWGYMVGAGPTWGVPLYDRQVVQLEGCIPTASGEPNYVVLPIIDKLGALLDVDIVCANIEHHSNVTLVLWRRQTMVFHKKRVNSFLFPFVLHLQC